MGDGVLAVERFAEARAPELESLFAALQSSGKSSDGLASIKRRTKSHNRRKHRFWNHQEKKSKKKANASASANANAGDKEDGVVEGEDKKRKRELKVASLSRRVRRRVELQDVVKGKGGSCKDGTRRLVTHVWHAKRFYMAKRWGYWLSSGIPGRGRCAATVLRWPDRGAVLHDASYYSAIQLEGPQEELSRVLGLVLEPLAGNVSRVPCYVIAMAHHCGKVPLSCIAPVKVVFCADHEKLWIFVHAAAFDEVFEAVQNASQGISSVTCKSRKDELATLEIFGKETFQLLGKVMKPGSDGTSSFEGLLSKLSKQACVELEVCDPRHRFLLESDPAVPVENETTRNERPVPQVEETINNLDATYWQAVMDQQPKAEQGSTSRLWGPSSAVEPPPSDKTVNKRQQAHRLSHFRLETKDAEPPSWKKCPILLMKYQQKALNGCSLVLPKSWVHAFWMSLVLAGARVIGQAERRWIMTHGGISSFPHDFPDCPAYKELSNHERDGDEEMEQSPTPVDREESKVSLFVPRTALVLSAYLQLHDLTLSQFKPVTATSWTMPSTPGACYLKVMIQPARKGVPEEGCLLYAPTLQDFHGWLDRAQKWQGLEIENQDGSEIRDRIGFVTSAPPWRSGDAAIAFCDASQLCKLRHWQEAESAESFGKDAKGILVFFHNPRSSKLRPALALVNLELEN
ncbi:ribonucleases P/MRP protein subunit POP1-like isoform X1 [Selaginella moellendorffii]|uniref:ribonucleases P/MRP protein subunit POP1-like isoform X1 n=1 Tax=Selaginella moellendorffii TaxID=88036 RepID=UPI000D1CE7F5|nr:ribonucleases P/MRP protein subunit POP1-like isoform X1 [Selaginella moellendorffii]|eukprot:XP_024515174.1 ribonucleases P/MRP protein subunit POP1-like isoform X1 [Selaginella moellendorffii]